MPHWRAAKVATYSGDIGADRQASDYWQAHYDDPKLCAVVNVYWYAVQVGTDQYRVEQQTETLVCRDVRDPGSTEVWSDDQYQEFPKTYRSAAAAEQDAQGRARRHRASDIRWNGVTRPA